MFVLVTQKEQQDLCAFTLLHTDPRTRQINHLRSHTATSWTRNRIEHFKKRWQTHSVWIWSCNVCTTHAPTCTHTHTEDYVRQVCVPGCRLHGPRKQLPLRAEPWEAREECDPTPFLGRRSAASSHPLTLWHHPHTSLLHQPRNQEVFPLILSRFLFKVTSEAEKQVDLPWPTPRPLSLVECWETWTHSAGIPLKTRS